MDLSIDEECNQHSSNTTTEKLDQRRVDITEDTSDRIQSDTSSIVTDNEEMEQSLDSRNREVAREVDKLEHLIEDMEGRTCDLSAHVETLAQKIDTIELLLDNENENQKHEFISDSEQQLGQYSPRYEQISGPIFQEDSSFQQKEWNIEGETCNHDPRIPQNQQNSECSSHAMSSHNQYRGQPENGGREHEPTMNYARQSGNYFERQPNGTKFTSDSTHSFDKDIQQKMSTLDYACQNMSENLRTEGNQSIDLSPFLIQIDAWKNLLLETVKRYNAILAEEQTQRQHLQIKSKKDKQEFKQKFEMLKAEVEVQKSLLKDSLSEELQILRETFHGIKMRLSVQDSGYQTPTVITNETRESTSYDNKRQQQLLTQEYEMKLHEHVSHVIAEEAQKREEVIEAKMALERQVMVLRENIKSLTAMHFDEKEKLKLKLKQEFQRKTNSVRLEYENLLVQKHDEMENELKNVKQMCALEAEAIADEAVMRIASERKKAEETVRVLIAEVLNEYDKESDHVETKLSNQTELFHHKTQWLVMKHKEEKSTMEKGLADRIKMLEQIIMRMAIEIYQLRVVGQKVREIWTKQNKQMQLLFESERNALKEYFMKYKATILERVKGEYLNNFAADKEYLERLYKELEGKVIDSELRAQALEMKYKHEKEAIEKRLYSQISALEEELASKPTEGQSKKFSKQVDIEEIIKLERDKFNRLLNEFRCQLPIVDKHEILKLQITSDGVSEKYEKETRTHYVGKFQQKAAKHTDGQVTNNRQGVLRDEMVHKIGILENEIDELKNENRKLRSKIGSSPMWRRNGAKIFKEELKHDDSEEELSKKVSRGISSTDKKELLDYDNLFSKQVNETNQKLKQRNFQLEKSVRMLSRRIQAIEQHNVILASSLNKSQLSWRGSSDQEGHRTDAFMGYHQHSRPYSSMGQCSRTGHNTMGQTTDERYNYAGKSSMPMGMLGMGEIPLYSSPGLNGSVEGRKPRPFDTSMVGMSPVLAALTTTPLCEDPKQSTEIKTEARLNHISSNGNAEALQDTTEMKKEHLGMYSPDLTEGGVVSNFSIEMLQETETDLKAEDNEGNLPSDTEASLSQMEHTTEL